MAATNYSVLGRMAARFPRFTIARCGELAGIGLQTGHPCHLRLVPYRANLPRGINFQRLDLPGQPLLRASLSTRDKASLRTTNLLFDEVGIGTVEHLLAALKGLGIDDILVELDGPEVPICDGSARDFVQLLKTCGRMESGGTRPQLIPTNPISFSSQATHLVALPSSCFRISCLIHYPNCPLIKSQYFTSVIDESVFVPELSSARTFCLLQEAQMLQDQGLMLGGSLENAVVIDKDRVLSQEHLRFADEMVRHKVLDMLGDLALLDGQLHAHVIAICPSHEANARLAEIMERSLKS